MLNPLPCMALVKGQYLMSFFPPAIRAKYPYRLYPVSREVLFRGGSAYDSYPDIVSARASLGIPADETIFLTIFVRTMDHFGGRFCGAILSSRGIYYQIINARGLVSWKEFIGTEIVVGDSIKIRKCLLVTAANLTLGDLFLDLQKLLQADAARLSGST